MNYIGKFFSNFKDVYNEINPATLTGAIDAVVVRQEDGSYLSSPFHVRFGKIGVLRSREKVVDIEINGQPVDIHMKLGESGEAFFVEEIEDGAEVSDLLGTSPLPNYNNFGPKEDDVRSQDSGVDAEEIYSKSLKDDSVKAALALPETSASSDVFTQAVQSGVEEVSLESRKEPTTCGSTLGYDSLNHATITHIQEDDLTFITEELTHAVVDSAVVVDNSIHSVGNTTSYVDDSSKSRQETLIRSPSSTSDICLLLGNNNILLDGQGSKTDVEDSPKCTNRSTRRRRKKRVNSKKYRNMAPDCPSSENSTTSETADLSSLSVTGVVSGYDPLFLMDEYHTRPSHHESNLRTSLPNICNNENNNADWPRTMGPDFHPFSDTDISPPPSLHNSRCNTPVKSDTEYECEKQKSELSEKASPSRENKWSWTWGELPTPPQKSRANSSSKNPLTESMTIEGGIVNKGDALSQKEEDQRSMLGSMFNFMRATRKARRNPENDGIYLDDLNLDELDPEVAALYFPRNTLKGMDKGSFTGFRLVTKDDDLESGNGTSLPQSPHSVYGAVGGPKNIDSDFEESVSRHPIFYYKGYNDLAFSACGSLHEYINEPFPEDFFMQSLVTYDEFCENPDVIYNPNLVVRLDGKYMNWATAAPQILSLVLFQHSLPKKVIDNVALDNMPKKEMRKRTASKGYSWFSWGRNNEDSNQKTINAGEAKQSSEKEGVSSKSSNALAVTSNEIASVDGSGNAVTENATDAVERSEPLIVACEPVDILDDDKQRKRNDSSASDGADVKVEEKKFRKTMRLSNEQIEKLNLKYGSNEVVFSVTTAYQGTTVCKCHIFLWNYDEKIVISDIDGTITKSDVLGHIFPIMGKDWAQGGVAQLFTKIKNNGYHFLYLSARAIGQARITRDYLRSVKQGDVSLPDGPLLLNPTSLISAFHREVIEKKPEEFKISCLRDIKALFPSDTNPFYAGYGNRVNDVYAYGAVGIPLSRIFTINHKGELKHELTQAFQTTYLGQVKLVDEMFPPIEKKMVPRNLLSYMYSEEEESEDNDGVVDYDYMDSDWEGFPTGIDAMELLTT